MATFYADGAGSQGTGDGSTAANAATLAECITNDAVLHTALVAGSKIWYKANATEETFDCSTGVFAATAVAGTNIAPIIVEAYTTSTGDLGIATLRDTDNGATNDFFDVNHGYWTWIGLIVEDARQAWDCNGNGNGHLWWRCTAENPLAEGWDLGNATGDVSTFIDCLVHSAGNQGFETAARSPRFINCAAIDCGAEGFMATNASYGAIMTNCIAYHNGGTGFDVTGEITLTNCVSHLNTGAGYDVNGAHMAATLLNCAATSNTTYGITGTSGVDVVAINCALNPTNETNTSGKSNAITLHEYSEVTGDPSYTDRDPATKLNVDLTPSTSSDWYEGGLSSIGRLTAFTHFGSLGAITPECSGGSGGVTKLAGVGGGLVG